MLNTIRRSILLLAITALAHTSSVNIIKATLGAPATKMASSKCCPRQGAVCPFESFHKGSFIDLGSFDDTDKPPFEIKVHKHELTTDRKFVILAEGQISTGYTWMPLDVLSQHEHLPLAFDRPSYYKDRLTRDMLMDASKNGVSAHGISASCFNTHTVGGQEPIGAFGVGSREYMKATVTVHSGISEGNYYVELAYGSPFRSCELMAYREIIVKVLP